MESRIRPWLFFLNVMREKLRIVLLMAVTFAIAGMIIIAAAAIKTRQKKTIGYTDIDNFEGIYVPADENPGLFFDTTGYITGSGVCIFLPCTADESRLVFYSTGKNGEFLERFEHDFNEGALDIEGVSIYTMHSDLPSINLSIAPSSPSINDVESSKDHSVETNGTFEIRDISGNRVSELMTMRGRGNTSWLEDKKSFQVTLEKSQDVLGMGKAKKWILIANAKDHTLLRNEVFLSLADKLGLAYTPKLRQVDLFINGEYNGTYSLCTKVENAKNRVELGDGDYLYRIGADKDEYSFFLYDDLTKKGTEEYAPIYGELRDSKDRGKISKASIYLKNVVNELYEPDSTLDDCDLESFAKYYWLQEYSKTTDPTLRSVYMYWKNDEQKMYMGPAWDYDRTAGIIEMPFREEDYQWPMGWTAREQDYYRFLFKNKTFTDVVYDMYYNGGVREAFTQVSEELPGRIEAISKSADMNFVRWNVLYREESNKIAETYGDTSHESHLKWLTDWLRLRSEWIEDEMKMPDTRHK